ncbi:MAG: hypothetical protein HUU37_03965 [Bdellovibrionales bacterium]|nr:hypothetical protein [Bdellovibrionales bacterium]
MSPKFSLIFALFAGLAAGSAAYAEALPDFRYGMAEKEARALLGARKPSRLEFSSGKLRALGLPLSPALDLETLPSVPLVEISQPGDAKNGWRYLAHPPTGRIWAVNGEGKLAVMEVTAPWKTRDRPESWKTLLDKEPPWNRPVRRKGARQ